MTITSVLLLFTLLARLAFSTESADDIVPEQLMMQTSLSDDQIHPLKSSSRDPLQRTVILTSETQKTGSQMTTQLTTIDQSNVVISGTQITGALTATQLESEATRRHPKIGDKCGGCMKCDTSKLAYPAPLSCRSNWDLCNRMSAIHPEVEQYFYESNITTTLRCNSAYRVLYLTDAKAKAGDPCECHGCGRGDRQW